MRKQIATGIAAGALIAIAGIVPANAADGDAQLSVLHGIPEMTVDVYVNGELTLDDFKPGTLAGPLELAAGTYSVAITASDAKDDSEPVLGPIDLPLMAGGNYTAAAHLTDKGEATATLFDNDISKLDAGQGRLTVRHVAAAPAVDVLANGEAAISELSNPDEKVLNMAAGTISAAVAAAGTTDPLIGPADVNVAEGVNTIVYAWGSLDDKNLDLAIQTIDGLHSNPDSIPAGSAGLVATNQPSNANGLLIGAGVLGLLAAAGGTVAARAKARR